MKQMQDLFRVIDRDGSGKLSPAELQAAIKAMGVVMSKAEVEFLVTQIDTDGDGEVGGGRARCCAAPAWFAAFGQAPADWLLPAPPPPGGLPRVPGLPLQDDKRTTELRACGVFTDIAAQRWNHYRRMRYVYLSIGVGCVIMGV